MWFEGREVKPYADSVEKHRLQAGSVYYTVTFFDDEMTVLELTTMVYLGTTMVNEIAFKKLQLCENGDIFVFQTASSYFVGKPLEPKYLKFSERELAGVYTFDAALNVVLTCAIARAAQNKLPEKR